MKPMIIIPPGQMSQADIEMLRKNEICVVVAKNPAAVKFVDPIPAASSRTQIENAAIKLSRCLLNGLWAGERTTLGRSEFAQLYVEMLVSGTPLDKDGSREEQREASYNWWHDQELEKIAREDARAERKKKKELAEKAQETKEDTKTQ